MDAAFMTTDQIKALTELGSFGLIVLAVVWLLWNIPRWIRDFRDRYDAAIDRHTKAIESAREQHGALIESANQRHARMLETFSAESRADRESCDARGEKILAAVRDELNEVRDRITHRHPSTS